MSKNPITPFLPTTRREFLGYASKGIGLLAFSRFAPEFLVRSTLAATPAPEKDRSILVLVQLAGGNDGLNTVIPFEDADYYRLRPTLGIPKAQVLRGTDTLGLHPSMTAMHALLQEGKLAVVQNVGYPNPNRSHFRSTEIWETGTASDEFSSTGWIGRYLDNACSGTPADRPALSSSNGHDPVAVHITNGVPQSFMSAHEHATFGLNPGAGLRRENEETRQILEAMLEKEHNAATADNGTFLQHTLMDALVTEKKVQRVIGDYRPGTGVRYPGTPFASSLRNVASLIAAGMPTRVYFVSLSGFDTHANQLTQQANLLTQLSEGLAAFQKDLEAHKLDSQVMTMTFSEFGRRPSENDSRGTDHGTAAPLFVLGSGIKAGFHGTPPALNLKKNEDMKFSTDFRRVYATALEGWLGSPSEAVLHGKFEPIPFV